MLCIECDPFSSCINVTNVLYKYGNIELESASLKILDKRAMTFNFLPILHLSKIDSKICLEIC